MENSYLITGLESSCTRHVSILIARNVGVLSEGDRWNGHDRVHRNGIHVVHRSLPHGSRDNYIDRDFWMEFGTVVLCTRDHSCSLDSKVKWHQRDRDLARLEQERGAKVMGEILSTHRNAKVYSHESAHLLGRPYNEMFFRRIGVPYTVRIETSDANLKYFSTNLGSS